MACAAVFLAAFTLYLRTLCPTFSSGDTGELMAGSFLLDVTHPPGYGMLTLSARLAMELPLGGPMFRAGLVSAAAGAALCVLVFAAARRLSGTALPAVCAASLLAVTPYVWWQATMLEKYALQICLAAMFLNAAVARKRLAAVLLFSIALTHHVQAVFLLPAFAWLGPAREWQGLRRLLLAAVLAGLPLSLKALYPAQRAHAIGQREAALASPAPPPYVNWGEPKTAAALFDYLRLEYYSGTLAEPERMLRSSFVQHLFHYPRELTWPGLLAALAGLAVLAKRSRRDAVVLGGIAAASFCFSLYFPLPPSLSVSYHQNAFLALVLAVPASLAAARALRPAAMTVALLLCFPLLGLLILHRVGPHDASRHWLVHDFNASAMRLAPSGAVLLGGFEYDIFAPVALNHALELREDLRMLPAPRKLRSGRFTLRDSYQQLAGLRLPGSIRNFSDADSAPRIIRRLLLDNGSRFCFVIGGLSAPLVSGELFAGRALLCVARSRVCGTFDPLESWKGISSRSWFSPERGLPPHRTALELVADCLRRSAADLPSDDIAGRERLLRMRSRLTPDDPAAWLSLASLYHSARRNLDAVACAKRALESDPDSCAAHALLLGLKLAAGARVEAREHALSLLSGPPFSSMPTAELAATSLTRSSLQEALPLVWRALSEAAHARATALPANPEMDMRRLHLLRLAAELSPDWAAAQIAYARALLARARYAEAAGYLRRYLELEPSSPDRKVLEAFLKDR